MSLAFVFDDEIIRGCCESGDTRREREMRMKLPPFRQTDDTVTIQAKVILRP